MSFIVAFIKRQLLSWPQEPNFSFNSRTIIVTGGSSGLGLEAARSLIELGAKQVIIACRNVEKGETAKRNILVSTNCPSEAVEVWKLDLNQYSSVLAFGERANGLSRLDAIVANAGIMKQSFITTEGDEETITTNVVSTGLLAFLLLPKLNETARKFHVNTHLTLTGSELYEVAKFKEFAAPRGEIFRWLADEGKSDMKDRYNVSKSLILVVVQQIAELRPLPSASQGGVIINVVAPG